MKVVLIFFKNESHLFSSLLNVRKEVLLISSYFTTCPGGGAGYVVVVAQDMWWGKPKIKLTQPSPSKIHLCFYPNKHR
jgi:hypothetical protein